MRTFFLGSLIWIIYRLISWTWRVQIYEPEEMQLALKQKKSVVCAHWHGDELGLIHLVRRYNIGTITSTSKDGELMNFVLKRLGASTSRGSSTRGAVGALKGILDLCKTGRNLSFAVDGPKGPIYEVKPGVFEVSRLRSLAIYSCGIHCKDAFRFPRSWNQTYLPKPFAKVAVAWRGPIPGLSREHDPRDPELAENLKNQLFAARHDAVKLFADGTGPC